MSAPAARTTVCARYSAGASFDEDSFADLTDVPVADGGVQWQAPVLCVTFDGELDDATAAAVRLRIVSPSREDEAARASLLDVAAALVDQTPDEPLAVLLRDSLELLLRPPSAHEGAHE